MLIVNISTNSRFSNNVLTFNILTFYHFDFNKNVFIFCKLYYMYFHHLFKE